MFQTAGSLAVLRVLPPSPPRAVQSTAMRSASPVSIIYDASTKTERDLRSLISTVGSYALKGKAGDSFVSAVRGCNSSKIGVAVKFDNWMKN